MSSLHRVAPVKFFHFVPAKSSEAKPSLRSSFMSGRLYCLASTESKSCWSSATSASAISVFTLLSDKSVKLVLQTTLPVLPAITRQPGFLWFVVRDSCVERLFVCTGASRRPAPGRPWRSGCPAAAAPARCRRPRCCWKSAACSSPPSSSIVREVRGVGHDERVGGEELRRGDRPELVTSPQTTLPVDTPPLVAVKVQSRLSQSSGPVEAAPVMVSVAPVSAPEAVSVPVDTSPTVVKFPALAVIPSAFKGELPDSLALTGSATLDGLTAQGNVGCDQLLRNDVNCTDVFTTGVDASGAVSYAALAATGTVAGATLTSTGAVSGSSLSISGAASVGLLSSLICMLYRSGVPADCCTSPGIDPPKAPKCSFAIPLGGTEKCRRSRRPARPCRGRVTPT